MVRHEDKAIKEPQKIEWVEEIEYYPIYIDTPTFKELKKLDRTDIVEYCIKNISKKLENLVFTVNRDEIGMQVDDMFDIMDDSSLLPCNSYLIMIRLNRISEEI